MRGAVPGLPSPHPLLPTLPGIYQAQPGETGLSFVGRFCDGLDEVLAPVVGTLDSLPAYLDVGTAPADFLPWLAQWIGMPLGARRSADAARQVLRAASTHQGWQGTSRGIALVVEAVLGCPTTVEESGGVSWSQDPEDAGPAPADAAPEAVVRVRSTPDVQVEQDVVERLVATLTPAHVSWRVEVVPAG